MPKETQSVEGADRAARPVADSQQDSWPKQLRPCHEVSNSLARRPDLFDFLLNAISQLFSSTGNPHLGVSPPRRGCRKASTLGAYIIRLFFHHACWVRILRPSLSQVVVFDWTRK